jgi:hypothetical protein
MDRKHPSLVKRVATAAIDVAISTLTVVVDAGSYRAVEELCERFGFLRSDAGPPFLHAWLRHRLEVARDAQAADARRGHTRHAELTALRAFHCEVREIQKEACARSGAVPDADVLQWLASALKLDTARDTTGMPLGDTYGALTNPPRLLALCMSYGFSAQPDDVYKWLEQGLAELDAWRAGSQRTIAPAGHPS